MALSQPEVIGISYQILFRIRVLHRYFLNYSTTEFDAAGSNGLKKKIELVRNTYTVDQYWDIIPDSDTSQTLRDLQMLVKKQPDGFVIMATTKGNGSLTPFSPLSDKLKLVFAVYPTDPFFMLYTDIAMNVMDELKKTNRVFRLKNQNSTNDPTKNQLNANETIRLEDIEDRPEQPPSVTRLQPPVGFIEIEHDPPNRTLLDGGNNIQPTLTYTVTLRNRTTHWRYKINDLGQFKLVQHGLIDVISDTVKLPNPTPATTAVGNDGLFYSTIY
ncbi:hypothetical protein GCM10028808_27530 [Spirosoma migulaei]